MRSEAGEHVDERLREAFAVDDRAVARVARGALEAGTARPTTTGRRLLPAFAAVTMCGLLAVAVWLSRPAPLPPLLEPGAASVAEEVFALSGSLVDGVLILPVPDGSIVIAGPGRRDDRPPDGYGIVMVEGEAR
jgi:hypothetical protein